MKIIRPLFAIIGIRSHILISSLIVLVESHFGDYDCDIGVLYFFELFEMVL